MTSSGETWTIGRLLQWTTNYLRERNVETPRLDAEVLLAHARGCQRIDLYATFDEVAGDDVRATFRGLVSRRADGVPVAYLVGYREFFSLSFAVTPDVLIPRPETELLVTAVLDLAKEDAAKTWEIADVGTGSGNIAVSIARYLPGCTVTALDASSAPLEIAKQNAQRHGVAAKITFRKSDLLAELPASQSFDVLVSNPPYVSESEYEELPREVKDHEPRSALVAGPRGTEVIERLIDQSSHRLRPGGWLIFEISPMIADVSRELLSGGDDWTDVAVVRDFSGHARVVQARRNG